MCLAAECTQAVPRLGFANSVLQTRFPKALGVAATCAVLQQDLADEMVSSHSRSVHLRATGVPDKSVWRCVVRSASSYWCRSIRQQFQFKLLMHGNFVHKESKIRLNSDLLISTMSASAVAAESRARTFQLLVAATKQLGIGKDGSLPWKLPGDMAYFKELTTKTTDSRKRNAVIMGRNTWQSIPAKFRPLKDRINVVLSRQHQDENNSSIANSMQAGSAVKDVLTCSSLQSAMSLLTGPELGDSVEHIFVIGGGQVYKEAIQVPECAIIHFTLVESDFDCDTYFPTIDPKRFSLWSAAAPQSDQGTRYQFLCYVAQDHVPPQVPAATASRHEEQQVGELCAKCELPKQQAVKFMFASLGVTE